MSSREDEERDEQRQTERAGQMRQTRLAGRADEQHERTSGTSGRARRANKPEVTTKGKEAQADKVMKLCSRTLVFRKEGTKGFIENNNSKHLALTPTGAESASNATAKDTSSGGSHRS